MSETRTHDWRELCLEAVSEPDPERRMAIVVELGRILTKDVHEFGPLRVDVGRRQVTQNGKPVCLTQLEFQLLRHLIERAGSPVSRNELLRSVWGYDSGAFTRTVDVHVGYLRQKLEQDTKHPALIITIRGVGYKFIALDAPESSSILANHAMRFRDSKRRKDRPLMAA
jgi:DNA-binding winged helix-turn-helix (wHTH) protein